MHRFGLQKVVRRICFPDQTLGHVCCLSSSRLPSREGAPRTDRVASFPPPYEGSKDSKVVEFYDSQSGKNVLFTQQEQTHGVFVGKLFPKNITATTMQLGESIKAFEELQLKGVPASFREELFAQVQSIEDVSAAAKFSAKGVCVSVSLNQQEFDKKKGWIQLARRLNLAVRCNLLEIDWAGEGSISKVLKLGALVGNLSDLDVDVMILHDSVMTEDVETRKESLQCVLDEINGIDCVGVPMKNRFGFYSKDSSLDSWVREEFNTIHRIEMIH